MLLLLILPSLEAFVQNSEIIQKAKDAIHQQSEQMSNISAATGVKIGRGFRFPRLSASSDSEVISYKGMVRKFLGKFRGLYDWPVVGYLLKCLAIAIRLPTRFEQLYNENRSLNSRLNTLIHELDTVDTHRARLLARLHQDESLMVFLEDTIKKQQHMLTDLSRRQDQLLNLIPGAESFAGLEEDARNFDAFYLAFEDRHRGSPADIRLKQQEYLPFLRGLPFAPEMMDCLDVGCGRGEWLKLLEEQGYSATGVDLNIVMVETCMAQGLRAVKSDVLVYFNQIPDQSLTMISGFHIIEHLPFSVAMKLLKESLRVLKSGGMILLETPNPENAIVGSCNFYTDPTHRNPIPPLTLHFMMDHIGFKRCTFHTHSPMRSNLESSDPLVLEMAKRMYGPQDYAAIAYKP